MKKNKKLKNVPKYAWGANETQAAASGLGLLSDAVSGKPATIGTALGGAAKGAAAGAMFGPLGAIVGGGVGLLSGSIGTGGSVNENTGLMQGPSGIAGLFGNSRAHLRSKAGRIKNGLNARQRSEDYAAEYFAEPQDQYVMAANGGVIPNTMAYLDDGELMRTPDGTIGSVPEEGKPLDSNLMNVPVGTQILSDKLKVPGTKKTFAEIGKKLMKPSNKKTTDKYSENSKLLNERNNQLAYSELLQLQESLKNKRGIKMNTKGYANGTANLDDDFRNTSIELIQQPWYIQSNKQRPVSLASKSTQNIPAISPKKIVSNPTNNNVALSSILDSASAIAAPLANMFTPGSEQVDTYSYSPRYTSYNYDITDQLQDVDLGDSISRYNMSLINPNTGAGMAYGLQSAVNRNKQRASLYNTKSNIENQMASRNTDVYNQWANQYANARHVASTEQAQNDAVTRNIRRKGIGDISTRLQQMSKDKKLTSRDNAMLEAMLPYLEYGMTSQQLLNLVKGLKK